MAKVKLNFLDEKKAIFCGDLKDFNEGYARYLEEVEDTIKRKGVYVILSEKQNFIHPKGESRVIYIGKSDNLNHRLSRHKKYLLEALGLNDKEIKESWWEPKYLYMRQFGAKVYYIPALKNKNAHNLEMDIMEEFYNRYFSLPVGNGAFSFGKSK